MNITNQLLEIVSDIAHDNAEKEKFAYHLKDFFDFITPEKISTEFSEAVQHQDYKRAVCIAAAYYRRKPDCCVEELSGKGNCNIEAADKACAGYMREVNINWHFANGDIDFLFNATSVHTPLNHEWLWQLNRHFFWGTLVRAYTETGNEKYAQAFTKQMTHWVSQTFEIPKVWNSPGSAWRTIECGIRLLGTWQAAFDGFRHSPSLPDSALLVYIASMHRQAVHLIKNPTRGNWLMMESNGAFTFSALFPEFSDSEEHMKTAAKRLLDELEGQILPDGLQNELSPDYHGVVNGCAYNFYKLATQLNKKEFLSPRFAELIKKTAAASVLMCTPAFTQPRTNDCYTIPTSVTTHRCETLFGEDPVWRYVNSNRAEGEPPKGETASKFLPYAGFVVMRSDWGAEACYLCFDVGPLGCAHVHQDKLNINLFKGSQELIYDDGGGQYDQSPQRRYALSGYGHNVPLVDGLPQNRETPKKAEAPIDAGYLSNDCFDYACGLYDDTFGDDFTRPATHRREIRFCKPDFFCVLDTLETADGAEHDYELLFHMDTEKMNYVPAYKNTLISDFGKKYDILAIPLDEDESVTVTQTCGQIEPVMQGWYNGRNESNLHKAVTVKRKVAQRKTYRFATLLFPMEKGTELPEIKRTSDGRITVYFKGKKHSFSLHEMNK